MNWSALRSFMCTGGSGGSKCDGRARGGRRASALHAFS
jgi:hypothetical protein